MGHINQKCTIDNFPYLFYYTSYLYHKYVCHIKHFTIIFKFRGHVRLRKCIYGYISYQSLNVGLWPKIEGFCHLHAQIKVIFLKHLLLAVTQQCSAKDIYIYRAMFFSIFDVRTMHSFFLLALYTFTCDVPNKYSIMHTCIKKLIGIFNGYTDR